jgi:hypothetical protein
MKNKVAEWLCSLPGTTDVEPVTLTIDDETWEGARYTQRDQVRYYLVGLRPKSHKCRSACDCYRLPGDHRDWYVASYLDKELTDKTKQKYHPFGVNWIMMPWDAPGRIDDCVKRYRRIEATVA